MASYPFWPFTAVESVAIGLFVLACCVVGYWITGWLADDRPGQWLSAPDPGIPEYECRQSPISMSSPAVKGFERQRARELSLVIGRKVAK